MGATFAKEDVMSAFQRGEHSSTFSGNPLVCAAASAAIDVLVEEKLPERAATNGKYFKGKLEDFWLLATRREDPDTLFFNRRLAIEGDTETGLYVKNMLDALEFDWEAHLQAVLGPGPGKKLGHMIKSSGIENRLRKRLGPPTH